MAYIDKAEKARRSIFIGNIPYGITEETIIEQFSRAGKVLSFRLVHDPQTGKPRGYGFMEYSDADEAANAIRNLNGVELSGRQLKVDWSNDGKDDDGPRHGANNQQAQQQHQQQASMGGFGAQGGIGAGIGGLPPLPAGTELPPGLTATDAISKTLQTLPPSQLLDIIKQMKTLVQSDPAKATELLRQAPQLTYAIFQALLLLGLVDINTLQGALQPGAPAPAPQAPPQQQYAPPPQQFGAHMQQAPVVPTPPPTVAQPVAPAMDPSALIQQVLSMPQAQIDILPDGPEKQQLLTLRATYGGMAQRGY